MKHQRHPRIPQNVAQAVDPVVAAPVGDQQRVVGSWMCATGPLSPRGLQSVPSGPTVVSAIKRAVRIKAA